MPGKNTRRAMRDRTAQDVADWLDRQHQPKRAADVRTLARALSATRAALNLARLDLEDARERIRELESARIAFTPTSLDTRVGIDPDHRREAARAILHR